MMDLNLLIINATFNLTFLSPAFGFMKTLACSSHDIDEWRTILSSFSLGNIIDLLECEKEERN